MRQLDEIKCNRMWINTDGRLACFCQYLATLAGKVIGIGWVGRVERSTGNETKLGGDCFRWISGSTLKTNQFVNHDECHGNQTHRHTHTHSKRHESNECRAKWQTERKWRWYIRFAVIRLQKIKIDCDWYVLGMDIA